MLKIAKKILALSSFSTLPFQIDDDWPCQNRAYGISKHPSNTAWKDECRL